MTYNHSLTTTTRRLSIHNNPQRKLLSSLSTSSCSWHILIAAGLILSCFVQRTLSQSSSSPSCEPPLLEIRIFDSFDSCLNRATPLAVGKLQADGACHITQVVSVTDSAASLKLPGFFQAVCTPNQNVDGGIHNVTFLQSGCASDTCTSSSSGGSTTCDHVSTGDDVISSSTYYSLLKPPSYFVQPSSENTSVGCLLLGDPASDSSIFFAIIGDCSEAFSADNCINNDDDDDPTATPTEAPTRAPITVTSMPTTTTDMIPTYRPTSLAPQPQTRQPIINTAPESSSSSSPSQADVAPSRSPLSSSGGGNNTIEDKEPSSAPVAAPATLMPTTTPSHSNHNNNNNNNSTHNNETTHHPTPAPVSSTSATSPKVGIMAGAIVGAVVALVMVLGAGFYAGSKRQKKKQQTSTGLATPTSYNNNHNGDENNGYAHWISGPVGSAGGAGGKEIVVDSNYDDDVSTLGAPWGVMSTGVGGATVAIEEGTVAHHSLAWDYKHHHQQPVEPSLAGDTSTIYTSQASSILLSSGALAPKNVVGTRSILADDASFDKLYNNDDDEKDNDDDDDVNNDLRAAHHDMSSPSAHTSLLLGSPFRVNVPAGKLGMVIDNAPGTIPEVKALKPDSFLVSRGVLVGDFLEQVDGIDVRNWTCVQVSQMIQKKSAESSRELVFRRSPRGSSSGAVFTMKDLL